MSQRVAKKPHNTPHGIKKVKSDNRFPIFALSLSLGGFGMFYLIPFVVSLVYAFVENPINMQFVGFKNFKDIFQNPFFLLGLKNTFIFMVVAIPLGMAASLILALALQKFTRFINLFSVIFLIPLVLPSATTAYFWMRIFAEDGILNKILYKFGGSGTPWLSGGGYAMGVIVFIFIWKNLGYNMILFMAGLNAIPSAYYSCASVFGANAWQRFRHVTIPYLTPSFFLVFIMSFVNSFKIFREVYLIWHDYPPESVYLLQHFVNNTLLSLNYHRLVSAVYVLTVVVVLVVVVSFKFEHRFSEEFNN